MSIAPEIDLKARGQGYSAMTNARASGRVTAKALFSGEIDGRGLWARRYRDAVASLCADAGGVAGLSELRLALIRRCAALIVESERMEGELASGKPVDLDLMARTAGHLRRIAETLGIDRVQRDVTPSLETIAARHRKPND